MKAYLKIVSAITLICFSVTNISFAQNMDSFKLSPPSSFSSMKGPEFKEAAQIQAGILSAVKDLRSLSLDSIKTLGQRQFTEKSVFGKRIEGDIYFNEASECLVEGRQVRIEKGSYVFRATTSSNKTYYVLVSGEQEKAGYRISVISDRVFGEALKNGIVKFTHNSVAEKDRGIIDLYLEHEVTTENNVAIDEWIRERMERGEYAVDFITREANPLYKNARNAIFPSISIPLRHIASIMEAAGVEKEKVENIQAALLSKPFILIPCDKDELPQITISGERIEVTAHSSPFATYIFVPRAWYEESLSNYATSLSHGWWSDEAIEFIERRLMHELGVMCGLRTIVKNGRAWNALDEAVNALEAGKKAAPSHELQILSPVDLLDLELRNDYAAGTTAKESIFKRVVLLFVASSLGVAGTSCLTTERVETAKFVKPLERPVIVAPSDDELARAAIKKLEEEGKKDFGLNVRYVYAASYLGDIGKPAVPALIEALRNSDYRIRECAASALESIADDRAIPALINALKDESGLVNYYARGALKHIGKPSVPFLVTALKDKDDNLRYAVAGMLNEFNRFPRDFKWEPQNDEEKASYAFARRDFKNLATMNTSVVIPYLLESLKNEYCYNREMAATGLSNLGWKPSTEEEKLLFFFASTDLEAMVNIGSPAVPILIKALRDYDSEIHRFASIALGRIGDKQAVPALIEQLKYEMDFDALASVVSALGKIGDIQAAPVLRKLLSAEEVHIFKRGDVNYDHIPNIRSYYAKALGELKDTESIPVLITALHTGNVYVRNAVWGALRNMGESSVVPLLKEIRNDEFGADDIGVKILVNIGKPAVPALIETLKDKNNLVRILAVGALGDIGDERAIPALKEIAADKNVDYFMGSIAEDAIKKILETAKKTETSQEGPKKSSMVIEPIEDWGPKGRLLSQPLLQQQGRTESSILDSSRIVAAWEDGQAPADYITKDERPIDAPPAAEPKKGAMLNNVPQKTMAATQGIETAIPDLNKIRFGEQWREERIIDVLWNAGLGVMSKGQAEEKLAALAPEVGVSSEERKSVYSQWLSMAGSVMVGLGIRSEEKHPKPTDEDIRQIVSRIKEAGVEVFIPKSQFPGDNISRYRGIVEAIGCVLRPYQRIEDLKTMIKNPERAIVMASDMTNGDADLLQTLKASLPALRVMNFAKMDDLDKLCSDELDNYEAEILSILLIARIITPEDLQDKSNSTYRMLSHLLEDYMPDGISVENYIQNIVTSATRLIKTVLKALPIAAYKAMRQSVEALWSV